MIKELFSLVLNMSITASVVIAAVISVRFMLKKQPKIYSYVLWSVVLFRLLLYLDVQDTSVRCFCGDI